MSYTIKFNSSKKDFALIEIVVNRAVSKDKLLDAKDLTMTIEAVHCNGNKLDLPRLLAADDFNFTHDIYGMLRHVNRRTGKLEHCFVPRFSARPKRGLYSQAAEDERRKRMARIKADFVEA